MRNIAAIFLKQVMETLKNKTILIQFVMFPLLAVIMEHAIRLENMPAHFFAKLFAVMFVGMAPLTCMSAIISEEKEKGTLRALRMANVSPVQYLLGVGLYIWLVCMLGAVVFAVCGEYSGTAFAAFLLIMAVGILLSCLAGAVIGICCRNQMTATSVTVPVMMVFSFLPMLSMFNARIEQLARFTYSQQIHQLIHSIGSSAVGFENIAVIAANFLLAAVLFIIAYRRKGLE